MHDDDESDDFYGAITQHMPLQGCLVRKRYTEQARDDFSK